MCVGCWRYRFRGATLTGFSLPCGEGSRAVAIYIYREGTPEEGAERKGLSNEDMLLREGSFCQCSVCLYTDRAVHRLCRFKCACSCPPTLAAASLFQDAQV